MNLLAQQIENPIGPKFTNQGTTYFSSIISGAVRLGLVAGVLIFFFIFVMGAIQWMTSGGDKAAVESARGKVINAIVGLVLLFLLFVILRLIGQFFGLDVLKNLQFSFSSLKLTQ